MSAGRPSKYDPKFIDEVDNYLAECVDEDKKILKQSNSEKGYEMYDTKLKVNLPTIEGFARYIDIAKKTLYNWRDEHEGFLHALEKIEVEQHKRLLNSGLSGEYNSTIAKLILSSNHGMTERTDHTTQGEKMPSPIYGGTAS